MIHSIEYYIFLDLGFLAIVGRMAHVNSIYFASWSEKALEKERAVRDLYFGSWVDRRRFSLVGIFFHRGLELSMK